MNRFDGGRNSPLGVAGQPTVVGVGRFLFVVGFAVLVQLGLLSVAGGPAPDGVRVVGLAQEILAEGLIPAWRRQGSEPVFPTVVAGIHWIRTQILATPPDWALSAQIAGTIGFILSVVFVYLIAQQLLGTPYDFLATVLFSLLPEMARLGADGISDAFSLGLGGGAIYYFLRSFCDTRRPLAHTGGETPRSCTPLNSQTQQNGVEEVGGLSRHFFAIREPSFPASWAALTPSRPGCLFLAGLFAAGAAMSHRAALSLAAFGFLVLGAGLFILWTRRLGRFAQRAWLVVVRLLAQDGTPDKPARMLPSVNAGFSSMQEASLPSPFPLSGPFTALCLWMLGFFGPYGIYWWLLQPGTPAAVVESMIEDAIANSPYPSWPPEHKPVVAGTHVPAPCSFAEAWKEPNLNGGVNQVAAADGCPCSDERCLWNSRAEVYFLRQSFTYRPPSAEADGDVWAKRLALVGQELTDACGYVLALPAAVGAVLLWPRRTRVHILAWGYALLHGFLCTVWAVEHGYIAARHFGPVVALGIGPAAWCLWQVGSAVGGVGRCILLGGVACLLAGDLLGMPPNAVAGCYREAARFLREQMPQEGWVADSLGYTGLWSGRYTIAVDDLWLYLDAGRVGYLVVGQEELADQSWRGELLRTLVDAAGKEIAKFSTDQYGRCPQGMWARVFSAFVINRKHFSRKIPPRSVVVFRWEHSRWQQNKGQALAHLRQRAAQRGILDQIDPPPSLAGGLPAFGVQASGRMASPAASSLRR